jgi:hypothetical protein
MTETDQVTGVDRRTLDAIFRHPLARNLSWREVRALLTAIGGENLSMKNPHGKDLSAEDVMAVRRLLTRTGWSPDGCAPSPAPTAQVTPGLIVVIDHAGAEIYRIDRAADGETAITVRDRRHLPRQAEPKTRDQDRDEGYPDDRRFFERIAAAVSAGGEIVVIGHGKGQSNEADHLSDYLQAHHQDIYVRIVREIVADLPRLSPPEILDLGGAAFR